MKRLHHICIQTDQYDASVKFYTEILGFQLIKETPNFHNRLFNSWLQLDTLMIELQTNKQGETLNTFDQRNMGIVHFCMVVSDIESEYQRIKDLGYLRFKPKLNEAIYTVENGKLFKLVAPEGTIIEFRDQTDI